MLLKTRFQQELSVEKLNEWQVLFIIRPKEKSLSPLSDRDLLPDNEQVYGMVLTYQFSLVSSLNNMLVFDSLFGFTLVFLTDKLSLQQQFSWTTNNMFGFTLVFLSDKLSLQQQFPLTTHNMLYKYGITICK